MRVALHALHFAEYAARLGLALAEQGHEVLLLLGQANAQAELSQALRQRLDDGCGQRLQVRLIPHARLRDPRCWLRVWQMRRALLAFAPDVIHQQETLSDPAFWSLWPLAAAPRVMTVHDPLPHSGADAQLPWRKRLYQRCLRRQAQVLIVHGRSAAADLAGLMGPDAPPVRVVAHGVLGLDADRPTASAGLAAVATPPRLLFFGRVEAYKGLGVLLQASALLRQRGVAHGLHVAGQGADLHTHRAALQQHPALRLDERFIAPADVPALFEASSAVVLPYLDATQSGVAAMAMAFGRPVVATRTGAIPEVVLDGINGLLVPPGDALALADALQRLLTEPDLLARLSHGASRFAADHLAWPPIAAATLDCYRQAAPQGLRALIPP